LVGRGGGYVWKERTTANAPNIAGRGTIERRADVRQDPLRKLKEGVVLDDNGNDVAGLDPVDMEHRENIKWQMLHV
jgi:hypothetical protein